MMSKYDLTKRTNKELLTGLRNRVRDEREITAEVVAHIAEVDAPGLFLDKAYSSMFAYCMEELRMSEPRAYKRIHAARVARLFPVIFEMLASGALHLSGVCLLAPKLTEEIHAELLAEATGKSKRAKRGVSRSTVSSTRSS